MPVQELPPAQVVGVGLDVVGRGLGDGLLLLRQELHLQLLDDRVRDFVLDGEDVGEVAIVAVGPDMAAVEPLMSCAVTRTRAPALRTLPSSTNVTPARGSRPAP